MSYNHENWQVDAEKYFKKLIRGGILIFQFFDFLRDEFYFFLPNFFLKINKIQKIQITSERSKILTFRKKR